MFPHANPDPRALAAVREGFARADYTESAICRRLNVASIHELALGQRRSGDRPPADATELLLRLLIEGQQVPREQVDALLPPGLAEALLALEIVEPREGSVAPAIALYPVEGIYIASDLGEEFPLGRADSVYPAISKSGEVYMGALPRTPCESFLEICSGTGIAALLAARNCGHALGIDIAERSTDFARFNAALNDLHNFTALQGDMYAPAEGMQFDRIAAHPPYVPAFEQRHIYRDGGTDGEVLVRRAVAEAFPYLKPGGRLYCTCVATEREDAPLEQRVRRMLGPGSDELDVMVLVTAYVEPIVHFSREVAFKRITWEQADKFLHLFDDLKIARFAGCTIVLERHATPRPPLTLRRRRSEQFMAGSLDGVLRWEAFGQQAGALERLQAVRPRLTPRARLEVIHTPHEKQWAMDVCRIVVPAPIPVELEASPVAATFLAWCDGERTVRDHLDRLVAEGAAPDDAPEEPFAGLVLSLLKEGVLEAEVPAE